MIMGVHPMLERLVTEAPWSTNHLTMSNLPLAMAAPKELEEKKKRKGKGNEAV
jgi:hypothetical protein